MLSQRPGSEAIPGLEDSSFRSDPLGTQTLLSMGLVGTSGRRRTPATLPGVSAGRTAPSSLPFPQGTVLGDYAGSMPALSA